MMTPRQPEVERRKHGRRDDDVEPEVKAAAAKWYSLVMRHKIKSAALLSIITSSYGYALGVRKVGEVEARVSVVEKDMRSVKASITLQNYLACATRPVGLSAEVDRLCRIIIQAGITP